MIVESEEQRRAEMDECAAYFAKLWNERVNAEPRNDLISMMAHSDATRHMDPRQPDGQHHPADRRRQRHHPQHHERLGAGAERKSRSVPEAARQSGADRHHGAGGDPLADAAGAYAAHRAGRHRTRRQDHQEGRPGRDVVRLGQPRRRGDREPQRLHHRPRPARAPICRSASASTAASACGSPNCS